MKILFSFLLSIFAASGATSTYLADAPRTNSAVFVDTNVIMVGSGIYTWGLPWSWFNKIAKPLGVQSGTSLDWSGTFNEKTLVREVTGDTTFTFANLPTSTTNSISLVLILTNNGPAGVASVTFPATVQWIRTFGAPNVTQVSNSVTVFRFVQAGGGRVFGFDIGRDTSLIAGGGITLSSSGPTTTVSVATGSFMTKTNPTVAGTLNLDSISDGILKSDGAGNVGIATMGNGLIQSGGTLAMSGTYTGEYIVTNAGSLHGFSWTNGTMFAYATNGPGHSIVFRYRWTNSTMETAVSSNGSAFSVVGVVTAGGNVGIGTATPKSPLHVVGGFQTTGTNFFQNNTINFAGGGDIYIGSDSGAYRQRFLITDSSTATDPRFAVQSDEGGSGASYTTKFGVYGNGSVGIGTTTPASLLDIAGTQNSYLLRVNTNGLVWTNGFVGVGTATPTANFEVVTNGNRIISACSLGGATANLIVGNVSSKKMALISGTVGAGFEFDSAGSFSVGYAANANVGQGNGTYPFTVSGGGNVGIGTTSPLQSLHVTNGVIRTDGGIGSYATNAVLTIGATGVTNTLSVNAIAYEFAGTSVIHTRQNGNTFSRGTISAGIDIVLKPGESLTGTLCSSVTNLMAW